MASITSVISIFVLLLAAYCNSLPVNSATDGSTPAIELTTGQTMGGHGNNGNLHLATEEELKKLPKEHSQRASAERESGESATTDQPADQDTSSPMTSSSAGKTNDKRAYYVSSYQPSLYRLYDGNLATSSVLADGTVLSHSPIYTHDNLVSYVTSYKRESKDEVPPKEGEPSTGEQKQKRNYIYERSLYTPFVDNFGRVFEMKTPISEHYVVTRELKDNVPPKEGEPSTGEQKQKRNYIFQNSYERLFADNRGQLYVAESPITEHYVITRESKDNVPPKEGEPSTGEQKQKRNYIYERSLYTPVVDNLGRIFEMKTPISEHYVITRESKDNVPPKEGEPSKEGESKQKRDFLLKHNYYRLASDYNGNYYSVESPIDEHYVITRELKDNVPPKEGEPSTGEQKQKRNYLWERSLYTPVVDSLGRVFDLKYPISEHYVITRESKDNVPPKEGEPTTGEQKNKRELFYEDSSLVRLVDGTLGRGSVLSHGSVLSNGDMLTHGPIYTSRNMLVNQPLFIDGVQRTYVSVNSRGIKDQTNDKAASNEESSSTTGNNLVANMETSTKFEPRAIKPMDGQSGEETSTSSVGKMPGHFSGNKNEGSSEETHQRFPGKIPNQTNGQKPEVNVPGSKQSINQA